MCFVFLFKKTKTPTLDLALDKLSRIKGMICLLRWCGYSRFIVSDEYVGDFEQTRNFFMLVLHNASGASLHGSVGSVKYCSKSLSLVMCNEKCPYLGQAKRLMMSLFGSGSATEPFLQLNSHSQKEISINWWSGEEAISELASSISIVHAALAACKSERHFVHSWRMW